MPPVLAGSGRALRAPPCTCRAAATGASSDSSSTGSHLERKLEAFETSLGGLSRPALMQLLGRAPPQVCSFSGESFELTLASLEAALGMDRAFVIQLVRAAPHVLVAPHEPVAVLRLLTAVLRLPRGMVAANLRTRLHVLALSEAQLRERCATLGAILECEVLPGSSSGEGFSSSSSSSSSSAEAGFAAFAARYPGQALALVSFPEDSVAKRLQASAAALDGAPASAVAALARARPLVLELSPLVLRSRAMVLAEAAFCDSLRPEDASSHSSNGAGGGSSGGSSVSGVSEEEVLHGAAQRRPHALRELLAALDGDELEGLADRLMLAPHSLHLWLQQLRGLLPALPPLGVVRLLLRLRVRPPDVLVRWQALQLVARGGGEWEAELREAGPAELATLLSASHEAMARMRYLSSTGRRGEARLEEAVAMGGDAFLARFPGFQEWLRCGG
jgi:hypothetical protein